MLLRDGEKDRSKYNNMVLEWAPGIGGGEGGVRNRKKFDFRLPP
jgi:hypothetical protein